MSCDVSGMLGSKPEHGVVEVRMPRVGLTTWVLSAAGSWIPNIVHADVRRDAASIALSRSLLIRVVLLAGVHLKRGAEGACSVASQVVSTPLAQAIGVVGGSDVRYALGRASVLVAKGVREVLDVLRTEVAVRND